MAGPKWRFYYCTCREVNCLSNFGTVFSALVAGKQLHLQRMQVKQIRILDSDVKMQFIMGTPQRLLNSN